MSRPDSDRVKDFFAAKARDLTPASVLHVTRLIEVADSCAALGIRSLT